MKLRKAFIFIVLISFIIILVGFSTTLNFTNQNINKQPKNNGTNNNNLEYNNDINNSFENLISNDINNSFENLISDNINSESNSNNKFNGNKKLQKILNRLDNINQNKKQQSYKQKLPRFNLLNNPFNKINFVYKRNEQQNLERAQKIKESMKFAWDSYKQGAWGHDEWLPSSNTHSDWLGGLGLTIIDSLDTLHIMGLKKELEDAKNWVKDLIINNVDKEVSVFEANIRYLGAFLTMYDFTGEDIYYIRAKEWGELLMNSFSDNENLFPASYINLLSKRTRSHDNDGAVLAALGTMSLEFARLSDITGNPKYKQKIDKVTEKMSKMPTDKPGLFKTLMTRDGSKYLNELISIGGMGDSYYEYLLKMWIYTDGEEEIYKRLFEESADSIIKYLYKITDSDFGYIANYDYGNIVYREEHLTCFAGGMFALAAASNITGDDEKNEIYMEVGAQVTRTCAESYFVSPVGLGPEVFVFNNDGTVNVRNGISWYYLRPETVESIFILYRLTGNTMYQDWGWKIYEALENNCRISNGYVGFRDINSHSKDSTQQSFFMAETLKYLYLLFSPSTKVPLDKYVLNTEAHPLLIKYKNK